MSQTGESVSGKASEAAHRTQEAGRSMTHSAQETGKQGKNSAEETYEKAKHRAQEAAGQTPVSYICKDARAPERRTSL